MKKMTLHAGFFLLAFLLLHSAPMAASAQTGDDALRLADRTPGLTARNMGLAGTGVAGVMDASAFFSNPAGLGWAERSTAAGSFASGVTSDKGNFNAPGVSTSIEDEFSESGLGSLSYLFKAPTSQGSIVLGASVSEVMSWNRTMSFDGDNGSNSVTDYFMPFSGEFELVDDGDGGVFPEFSRPLSFIAFETYAIDLDGGLLAAGENVPFLPAVSYGTVAQFGFVEDTGKMYELNFGGAAEAAKDVMVGFSLNIPVGSFERFRVLEEDDYLNDNDGTGGTTDFAHLYFSEELRTDIVGVNARFGVSAQPDDNIRVGATIETPTYYAIEESYSTYLETEFDNGDFYSYGDASGQNAASGSFDYTLKTPWKLSAGASYSVGNLAVMGDVEWLDWSQMEFDANDYDFKAENLEIRNSLESVLNIRLAASYDVADWQVRAGFGRYPDARSTQDFRGEGFPTVDRKRDVASLGLGYRLNDRMGIDIAWMQESFDDRTDLYIDVTDAPHVLEEVTRSRFQIGFSYGF
ncbi:MAG: outer membrane protein transport protein [Bacteroidetes bacterium]|nr:outer membrane protein transport protein [Bacteroidota bacterium]MDA1333362.1 outer membrane protein transport protein [Bacteroidota bacterium]